MARDDEEIALQSVFKAVDPHLTSNSPENPSVLLGEQFGVMSVEWVHLDSCARMRKEFSASRTNLFGPLDPVPQTHLTQNTYIYIYTHSGFLAEN